VSEQKKEVTLIHLYRSIFFKDHLHHISMWSLAPILFFSLENKSFNFSYSEKEKKKCEIGFKKAVLKKKHMTWLRLHPSARCEPWLR